MSIISLLEELNKRPYFYYEFNQDSYPRTGFLLHELQDLGILYSKMERGEDKEHSKGFARRFYITDLGKKLLQNALKQHEVLEKKTS